MIIHVSGHQSIRVTSVVEYAPSDVAQIVTVATVADVNSNLNNKYFHLFSADDATIYTLWLNVGGAGVDPKIPNTTSLEIAIAIGDSANTIATLLSNDIDDSTFVDFSASASGNVVTITNSGFGGANAPLNPLIELTKSINESVETGFTFEVTTIGTKTADAPASATWFQIDGTIFLDKAVWQGNKYQPIPFTRKTVRLIIPENRILRIEEG